jgi:CBS domain-containing protein
MEKTRVRDIMTSPAVVIAPDTRVTAAVALMKQHYIRHLPVVDNGRLVGIVSQGDLREASTSTGAINANSYEINFMVSRLQVKQIMTRRVFTIAPEAFIVQAAELMTENKIAGLPVVQADGEVVGMITDSDLLRLLVRRLRDSDNQTTTDQDQAA